MDLMSALNSMSGDQFGGDTLQPSAIYSPEQPFGNDTSDDSRTSWTAHVTGVTPTYSQGASSDSDAQPQPANNNDSDDAQPAGIGAKSGGKFPKSDPYSIVGRVSSSLQTARPSNGS